MQFKKSNRVEISRQGGRGQAGRKRPNTEKRGIFKDMKPTRAGTTEPKKGTQSPKKTTSYSGGQKEKKKNKLGFGVKKKKSATHDRGDRGNSGGGGKNSVLV